MQRSLIALAIAAAAAAPAFAQTDNCSPSGYQEGVSSGQDVSHEPCDPSAVPRANGVPQGKAQPTARPGYNLQKQAQQRGYDAQNRAYDAQNRAYDSQNRAYDSRNRAYEQDRRNGDQRYDRRDDRRYGRDERGYDQRYQQGGEQDRRDWERYRGEGGSYYGARGPEWRRGGHIPREYLNRQYWVEDWRAHHLAPPPRGYQWVQVGSDYVLVALASGIIAQLLLAQ